MDTPGLETQLEYLSNLISDWRDGDELSPEIVAVLEKAQVAVSVVTLWDIELLSIEDMNFDMRYLVSRCFNKIGEINNDRVSE